MDDHFLKLDNGRRLAYRITGCPDGLPLFFFHGLAQSRLTMHPDTSIAQGLGICLITIDRPGVGLSDPQPTGTILGWATDINVLADHLGYPQFSILAHSAGAPYAIACAYALSQRVLAVTTVSAVPQPSLRLVRSLASSRFWKLGLLLFAVPQLARPAIWAGVTLTQRNVMRRFEQSLSRMTKADRCVMADPAIRDMRIRSMLEAFRQGTLGLHRDVTLLRRTWGFDPSSVRLPIRVWHGEADNVVTIAFGREFAERLGNARTEFQPGCGHNLLFSHWQLILEQTLLDSRGSNRSSSIHSAVDGGAQGCGGT